MNQREVLSARKMEIIEAAGKILTSAGVNGLTIKNLAKEMKFSESAIYRHFTSKEAIIVTMLDHLAVSLDERYALAMGGIESPIDKLMVLFQNQFSFFKAHPYFVAAVFSDGLMEESFGINDSIFRIMSVKIKYLQSIISEGQDEGFFIKSISPEDLTHIIMGSVRLFMFKWRISGFDSDIENDGNLLIQSLLKLIKN